MNATGLRSVSLSTLVLALWVFPAFVLAQQDTGTIVGTVFDPGGAVVPGATVRLTNIPTNISVAVSTDSSGVFTSPPLRIGNYRMEVEVSGFKKSIRDGIGLRVARRRAGIHAHLFAALDQRSSCWLCQTRLVWTGFRSCNPWRGVDWNSRSPQDQPDFRTAAV